MGWKAEGVRIVGERRKEKCIAPCMSENNWKDVRGGVFRGVTNYTRRVIAKRLGTIGEEQKRGGPSSNSVFHTKN